MNCQNCQTPLPADAAFCPNCGTRPGAASSGPALRTLRGRDTIAPIRESTASVLEPGTMFADRYSVIRKLGEGGMGIVYVATDTHTKEEMVLKLIHPELVTGDEAIRRLMAEGLTARQIRHPNIVAVYDVSQFDGQPFFTMEYVKGGTLRSWMVEQVRAGRDVPILTARGLMKSMLAGLAEAHRMGVVHRDLKPENVLLVGDPNANDFRLKILDFGIAKAIDAPVSRGGGGAIGTPIYMAPEQMTSADAVGPQADIYSLTVMLYELLMDAPPQARWEPVSKSRPGVPKALDDLIEKGLSARPRSRFATAAEYEAALDAATSHIRPEPPPRPEPAPVPMPEPVPVPPSPLPPTPVPSPSTGGMSPMAKIGLGLGAGFVALLVIASLIGEPETGTDPPPPPAPTLAGTWQSDFGESFSVQVNGPSFSGTGMMNGLGPVELRGTIAAPGVSFAVFQNGQQVLQGAGQIRPDQRHIDYQICCDQMGNRVPGVVHINHPPGG